MATKLAPGITSDPNIMGGEPCIEGTRVPAHTIQLCDANGMDVKAEYRWLTSSQVEAALAYVPSPFKEGQEPLYAVADATVLDANDDDLTALVTFGALERENANGWMLMAGVTGGESQMVQLSDFGHSLGSPFSASGPPVGVGELYEAEGELRLQAKWNPDMQAGREAQSAVKFAKANGAPLSWSYGVIPLEKAGGEDGKPLQIVRGQFTEASPQLIAAHKDSTTLAASRILSASAQGAAEGDGQGMNPGATPTAMAEEPQGDGKVTTRPLHDMSSDELKGFWAKTVKDAVAELDDAPRFQAMEKQAADYKARLDVAENRVAEVETKLQALANKPASGDQLVAAMAGNSIEQAWAAHKQENGLEHDEIVRVAKSGVYQAHLDIDIDQLWAATMTRSTGVTPNPQDGGYAFASLNRVRLIPALPSFPTSQSLVRVQTETLTTGAATGAEGAAVTEGNISYADTDIPVQRISGWVPISEVELEDAPFIDALVGRRLGASIESVLEGQALEGNGTSPNLQGINTRTGVQTETATYSGTKATRVNNMIGALGAICGKAEAASDTGQIDLWVLTSSHFWFLASAQDSQNRILLPQMADPAATGIPSLFGVTAVRSGGQDAAKQTIINLSHTELRAKRGLEVEIGLNASDFSAFRRTVRASMQVAVVSRRPAANGVIAAANA